MTNRATLRDALRCVPSGMQREAPFRLLPKGNLKMSISPNTATETAPVPTAEQIEAQRQQAAASAAAQASADRAKKIREAFTQRVTGNIEQINEAYSEADRNAASGGFHDLLAASKAIALSWDDLSVWAPANGRIPDDKVSDMELRMRQLHNAAHPYSSPEMRKEVGNYMRLAVYASKPDVAAAARDMAGSVYKQDPSERTKNASLATAADARAGLEAKVATLRAAGADNKAIALVEDFIAAIDDATKLAKLGKRLNSMQTAAGRWRSSLYLNLVGDDIERRVDASDTAKVSQVWDKVCAAAAGAHAKFMSDANGQPIDPIALENSVMDAARKELDAVTGKIEKVTPKATKSEKEAAAANGLYRYMRACLKLNLLPLETYNLVHEMLEAAPAMPVDSEGAELARKADERAKEQAEKEARDAAAKAAAEAKAKAAPAKAAAPAPQTMAEKLAAARALVAALEAGEEPTPAPVAETKPAKPSKAKGLKAGSGKAAAATETVSVQNETSTDNDADINDIIGD